MDFELAQLKKKAQTLAEGAKIMAYDLVCPGEADLALGLSAYRDLVKTAGLTPICANLKLGTDPVFPATAVREIAGVKIGFFGVMNIQRPLPAEGTKNLVVDPYEPTAAKAVSELKGKVDLIVALTHIGFDQDRVLIEKVPGIDIVIGGHSRDVLGSGTVLGKSAIFQSGYQGKYVGSIRLRVRPPAAAGQRPTVERVAAEAVPMEPSIKDEPRTAQLAATYRAWVNEQMKNAPSNVERRPTPPADVYWTATLCGQCHPKQDEFVKGTLHSQAYSTLVKKNKQADMECLPCHTTGFAQTRNRPENKSLTDVTGLESVQCESCHGPGSRHNTPEIRASASRKATCVKCHDAKNSPKFNFEAWLQRVRCPSGSTN